METANEEKLPYHLEAYIREQQRQYCEGQLADHRAPSGRVEDKMRQQIIQLYHAGQMLIEGVRATTPLDLTRCLRLYASKTEYGTHELVETFILGSQVVVPRYFTLIEEVRRLVKILEIK